MQRLALLPAVGLLLVVAAPCQAADAGYEADSHIRNTPQEVMVQPPPPTVVVEGPTLVIEAPPVLVAPPRLGFYLAVGVPYEMFYLAKRYYLLDDDVWYKSRRYDGPWQEVSYKRLPAPLRKYKMERIRQIREEQYQLYEEEGHYWGQSFQPGEVEEEVGPQQPRHRKERDEDDDDDDDD